MKLLALLFVVVATGTAMVAAFIALGSASGGAPVATPPQHVTMEVWPGDRIVGQNLVVQPGRIVVTIINYARHAHTFSVPSLGVERVALPGSPSAPTVTTVKFTASDGVYGWLCKLPCGHGMRGDIYVVSYRPNLHGPLWAQG
jgi:plastocyanin